nr:MAG: replication initiator protein [Microvirus sp.]
MTCFHPLQAFQCSDGSVVFVDNLRRNDVVRSLSLPCGQCIGCRLARSRMWAMRCMHEASLYKANSFITLTYSDEFLPDRGRLEYPDFQKFMKRLRKRAGSDVRFYMCGEYGPENWRPHYHALLFGFDFADKRYSCRTGSGEKVFSSNLLSALWPYGYTSVGAVTFESAAYVARYCVQKVTGDAADEHYKRYDMLGEYNLPPEFNHMSLKPGIGARWFDKYKSDVYNHDYVVINGKECAAPKYYDKLFSREFPEDLETIKHVRESRGRAHYQDNTPERLAVKEIVQRARMSQLHRSEFHGV